MTDEQMRMIASRYRLTTWTEDLAGFARALLAAGASEGQAEPAAQIVRRKTYSGLDVWDIKIFDKDMQHGTKLYTHPSAEIAVQANQRQSFEFEAWFDREFPMDPPPSRPKYQRTSVTNLMRAAWDARDAEIAALRERIAGMEKDAERYQWLRSATYDKAMPAMFDYDRSAHRYLGIRRSTEHLDEAIDAAIAKEKQG
jgi:hypothetical protein